MERCEGTFAPTAGCLSSPHMARWLLCSLTRSPIHSLLASIFFSLCLTAALIKRWIHAVCCLLFTVWGVKHTHQTRLPEPHESSLERKTRLTVVELTCIRFMKRSSACVHSVRAAARFHSRFYVFVPSGENQTVHVWFSFIRAVLWFLVTSWNSPHSGRWTVCLCEEGVSEASCLDFACQVRK